mgnify:CR=1 FL=1
MGAVTRGLLRTAGTALGGYLDDALKIGGAVGQEVASAALRAGKSKFAPDLVGATGKEVPKLLREGPKQTIPQIGKLAGQALVGGGLFSAASFFDQQSEHTQPMSRGMDNLTQSQILQNQKFMHDMALIQARQESRVPGAQYGGSLADAAQAEKIMSEAGEVTNQEVQGLARMIYGTGLRA